MRLPVERRLALTLSTALVLSGCSLGGGGETVAALPALPANGPQADYPVTVGDPYTIEGVTFTPVDGLNYDAVGFAVADGTGGPGITAAHHTLPLPSYVEVTSLESGRTVLVRVERRGPMDGTQLVALSPGALAQLGASDGVAVRVRRVNPPEDQRALLRAGQSAPLRLETPMGLVEVLRRRLPAPAAPAQPAAPEVELAVAPAPPESAPEPVVSEPVTFAEAFVPEGPAQPEPVAEAPLPVVHRAEVPAQVAATAAKGHFVVQAAAFSISANAEKAARVLGGEVSRAGNLFRVRTGPFATRGEAEASLAKVRAAGYKDARIQTSG